MTYLINSTLWHFILYKGYLSIFIMHNILFQLKILAIINIRCSVKDSRDSHFTGYLEFT